MNAAVHFQQTASVTKVELNDTKVNYKAEASLRPTVTADADAQYGFSYSSDNPNVAAVNDSGVITGVKRGRATVTCTLMM